MIKINLENLRDVTKSFVASYFFKKPTIITTNIPTFFNNERHCNQIYRYRTSYFSVNEYRQIRSSSISLEDQVYTREHRIHEEIYNLTHLVCPYYVNLRNGPCAKYVSEEIKDEWINENLTGIWESGGYGLYYYFEDEQDYLRFLFTFS